MNLSRTTSLPRFGPGSDVELTDEEKLEQQAVRSKEFYDVSSAGGRAKTSSLRWTLDQMNLRLSHSREHSSESGAPDQRARGPDDEFQLQYALAQAGNCGS